MSKKRNFFGGRVTGDNVFRLEVVVASSETINLPLESGGTYSFTVNYGEGGDKTVTAFDDVDASYTYTTGGTYELTIDGTCTLFKVDGDATIDTNIYKVKNWGSIGLTELDFNGCENLTVTATDTLDISGMTSFDDLFRDCRALTTVNGIDTWDTSGITSMERVFYIALVFNDDITGWDTSGVTSFVSMFQNARLFNQDISGWDTSSATNMSNMFNDAEDFNQNLNTSGSQWDVSGVTTFTNMFANCDVFNGTLTGWVTSSATNISGMFTFAPVFNQTVDHFDVDTVTTFVGMFHQASSYNKDMNSWTLPPATGFTMQNMFLNAIAFNGNVSSWDMGECTNLFNFMRNCDVFTGDLSGWVLSKVTTMNSAFSQMNLWNPTGATSIDGWNVTACTDFSNCFSNNLLFNCPLNSWTINTSAPVTMFRMFYLSPLFDQPLSGWDTSEVTQMAGMFGGTVATKTIFNQSLNAWNVAKVTNMSSMFIYNTQYNQACASWVTTALTTTLVMFQDAIAFNQSVDHFDMSSVTTMRGMFQQANAFNQSCNSWTLTSLTGDGMDSVFLGADAFNGNVTSWTIPSAVTSLKATFQSAALFNQDIGGWDVSNITSFNDCFNGASVFNQDLSSWDITSATTMTNFGANASFNTTNWDLMISAWEGLASTPSSITITIDDATYTETSVDSGTADTDTANKLVDSTQTDFLTTVSIGDIAHNTTDDTYAEVTAVDSNTSLSLDSDAFPDGNETYVIQSSQVAKDRYSLLNTHSWTINDGGAV